MLFKGQYSISLALELAGLLGLIGVRITGDISGRSGAEEESEGIGDVSGVGGFIGGSNEAIWGGVGTSTIAVDIAAFGIAKAKTVFPPQAAGTATGAAVDVVARSPASRFRI